MHSEQANIRKNTLFYTTLPHSQSQKLLPNQPSYTQAKFRKRSVKLRNIPFNQQPTPSTHENTHHPIQQSNQYQNTGELKFLTQILRKKHQNIVVKRMDDSQPKRSGKDYEYYDMIVRDLISQIRQRSSKETNISPQPLQKSIKAFKISPHKRADSEYGSIKLSSARQKMVFSLSLGGSDSVYERKITSYIEFLYKLNFCNRMYVDLSLSKAKITYKVRVGPGNNAMLVKSLLRRRFWLQLTNSGDFDFQWTQQTNSEAHDSQLPQTKIEEKARLKPPNRIKLLLNSAEQLQSKIMYKQEMNVANEWYERSDCGKVSCFREAEVGRVTNHIPLNCIIGAKRILFKVIHWYYTNILQVDPFTILPKTYSFENSEASAAIKSFLQANKTSKKVWIIKPGENSNRGNGIKIVETAQLITYLNRQRSRGPEVRPLIVQQYIKPFLYNGRKFDIRHYLLVTSHNGFIRGYWYREGYIRTSSERYDIEDMDQMIHLTNDAIQKKGDRYGKYQPANKLSYNQFQRYLDTVFPHKHYNFQSQILTKMKEITTHMLRAAFQFMDPQRKQHNFQLYGLDFYISSKFKPYLIECNANPCLQINCPILERIIPGAVEHALRIGLDPLFPPPHHYPTVSRYHLCDRIMQKLKYELIFDEKLEGNALRERTKLCNKLDLAGIKLRPEEDEFEDEGEELGEEAPLD